MNLVASLREILDQRVFKECVIVVKHLHQSAKVFVYAIEVDEFEHGLQLVVVAQLVDFFLGRLFLGKLFHKLVDGEIVDQGIGTDARLQHEAFQRGATAEGDVDLPMGEGLSCVDDDLVEGRAVDPHRQLVEGQSLAFVDSDRPCQS